MYIVLRLSIGEIVIGQKSDKYVVHRGVAKLGAWVAAAPRPWCLRGPKCPFATLDTNAINDKW